MQSIDMEYFSEYKTVERICRDIYGEDGVKAYIEEMETTNSQEKIFISNWDDKLRTLKHLKWLRNQIAHDNEAYEVTDQDLSNIKLFHDELLTQEDPLAHLYKRMESIKKKQQEYKFQEHSLQTMNQSQEYNTPDNNQNNETSGLKPLLAIAIGIAVVVLIAIIIFFFL